MSKVAVTFEIESRRLSLEDADKWAEKIVEQLRRAPDIKAHVVSITVK